MGASEDSIDVTGCKKREAASKRIRSQMVASAQCLMLTERAPILAYMAGIYAIDIFFVVNHFVFHSHYQGNLNSGDESREVSVVFEGSLDVLCMAPRLLLPWLGTLLKVS